jgi:DNA-binding response OmpR family regulator
VADDDLDAAQSLVLVLGLYGFKALAAVTALDALRVASAEQLGAVIMDIRWAGSDGYALAESVRGFTDHRPLLVALTGMPGYEDRSRAAGFDHHFVKPVDPAALAAVLAEHAERIGVPMRREAAGPTPVPPPAAPLP